jgi:hypothetical protein
MARYELLVDGQARGKTSSEDEARTWIRAYRLEHEEDDPDATHVQVRKLSRLAWLTGGSIVATEEFLDGPLSLAP